MRGARWEMLTSVQAVVGEDGASGALGRVAANVGGALPQNLRQVQELGDSLALWAVYSPRHVGSLTVVPHVGDGIGERRGEITGVNVATLLIGGEVLAVSPITLSPMAGQSRFRDGGWFDTYMSCLKTQPSAMVFAYPARVSSQER